MRYDAGHKQRTRERVLAEAGREIREHGPHRIGVAAVMAKAGLTQGGFYAHFGSKEELVTETIDRMFARGRLRAENITEGLSAQAALSLLVDSYLSFSHRDNRTGGCPLPFLVCDLPRLAPDARARFSAGMKGMRERYCKLLSEMGREDPMGEATSMISEMVGAVALARSESDPATADEILLKTRASFKARFGLTYKDDVK